MLRSRRSAHSALRAVTALIFASSLVGALIAPAAGAAPVTAAPLWGVDGFSAPPGSIDILESMMGRAFGATSDYLQLDQAAAWPDSVALRAMGQDELVFLNIASVRLDPSGVKTPICWRDVADGNKDGLLQDWVEAIVGSGYQSRLLISFNHEPEVSSVSQPRCETDTPADYQQAYDHVHAYFVERGVTAPFAFVVSGGAYRNGVVDQYLPPQGDFSVIGTDAYNKVADPLDPKYRTADQALSPFFAWRQAHAPNLLMLIGELGEHQSDPNAAQWIADAVALINSTPGVLAVNWNVQSAPDHPYSPLLNQASLAAWLGSVSGSDPSAETGREWPGTRADRLQGTADWAQFRGGPAHLGFNSKERLIGRKNVGTLTGLWSAPESGLLFSSPAVAGGTVYVGSGDHNLYAFDAAGVVGCQGSPPACDPLWAGPTGGFIASSPAVANGVVYVGSFDGRLYAFDATGVTGCGGAPRTCAPLWTADVGGVAFGSPVVKKGIVYVGSQDGNLYAFSAAGKTNCGGTPKTCAPLWTGPTGRSLNSSPAVAGGTVYVGSDDHRLYAFDAAGVTGCGGVPKTCAPLWTAMTGDRIASSPAVAGGVVYVGSDDFRLYAFDAAGVTGCSGTPPTCSPLWTADAGGIVFSSPAVAHGVVFIGSSGRRMFAFDAAGIKGCAGAPRVCLPLVSIPAGDSVDASPAVANGMVVVGSNDRTLYVETVPAP
jgi:outer membrane protein assembly factor BamB